MAWLQNLAGRAEDLLNKIDQNAATVLSEGTKLKEELKSPFKSVDGEQNKLSLNVDDLKTAQSSEIEHDHASQKDVPTDTEDENILHNVIYQDSNKNDEQVRETMLATEWLDKTLQNSPARKSLTEKITQLEMANQDLNKQLLLLKHMYSVLKNENNNLMFQLDKANEQLTAALQEKEQYMIRAQRVLQKKEKLIALKRENDDFEVNTQIFATYNEALKKELEFEKARNQDMMQKLTKLTNEVQSLHYESQTSQQSLNQSIQSLEQKLVSERQFRNSAEEECTQRTKELQSKIQEVRQAHEVIKMKNDEINHLQDALKQRTLSNPNEDFEARIKSLTQILMVKQNTLETVTTERNALRLQLEKLESEYKEKLMQAKRDSAKIINVPDMGDGVPLPKFMRISPFDAGVTRRVKNAYSTLDAISVRTGVFLRRYPLARVIVFCYIIILHIWVIIILFLDVPSNP